MGGGQRNIGDSLRRLSSLHRVYNSVVLADRGETTDSRRFSVFDYFRFRFRWAAAGAMMDDGMMSAVGVHVPDPRRSSDTGRCSGAACRRRCCGDPDGERRRPGCTAVLCGSVCTRTMLVVVNLAFFVSTHTHPFNGPYSGTTRVGRYQKGKTNLDFTETRDSEWQWHQLGHMQVCTSLQTDNHASTPPLSFHRPDALSAAQPTASKH